MKKNSLSTKENSSLTIYIISDDNKKITIKINDKVVFNKKVIKNKQYPESVVVEIKEGKNIISVESNGIKLKKDFYCDKEKDYWAKIWYDSTSKKLRINVEDQPIMFW